MAENYENCQTIEYANNSQFLHSSYTNKLPRLISDTVSTLKSVKKYFLTNGLILNSGKTRRIFVSKKQLLAHVVPPNTVMKIDEDTILPSNHVNIFVVHMGRYMLFDEHTEELSKNVVGMLTFLSQISVNVDKHSRIVIVQCLLLSMIYYILLWGTTNLTIIYKVQKLQKFYRYSSHYRC